MSRLRLLSTSAVVFGLMLGSAILAFDRHTAQAAPEDDIRATLDEAAAAWNAEDFETFVTYFTEAGLGFQFDETDVDALIEVLPEIRGDTGRILDHEVSELVVLGGNANGIVYIEFENQFIYEKWSFYYLDGGWKIGAGEYLQLPEDKLQGLKPVELTLKEYSFNFDPDEVEGGNFAFQTTNVGQQAHEVVAFRLTTSDPLNKVIETIAEAGEDEEPEGIEFVAFGGVYDPGTQSTGLFPSLAPGRYALMCFLPSPDGVPHVLLGMAAEFQVGAGGAGGGIKPPSTGDAGLLARPSSAGMATLVLAMVLVTSGIGVLLITRKR